MVLLLSVGRHVELVEHRVRQGHGISAIHGAHLPVIHLRPPPDSGGLENVQVFHRPRQLRRRLQRLYSHGRRPRRRRVQRMMLLLGRKRRKLSVGHLVGLPVSPDYGPLETGVNVAAAAGRRRGRGRRLQPHHGKLHLLLVFGVRGGGAGHRGRGRHVRGRGSPRGHRSRRRGLYHGVEVVHGTERLARPLLRAVVQTDGGVALRQVRLVLVPEGRGRQGGRPSGGVHHVQVARGG